MADKKKNILYLFVVLKNLLKTHAQRLSDLFYLISLEANLAGKTLVTMAFLALLFLFVLCSTWLSLLFFVFFILVTFNFSSLFAAGIVLIINVFLLLLIMVYVKIIKKNLAFPATRRQFHNIITTKERYEK